MEEKKIQEVISDLLPSLEDRLDLNEVVARCKKRGIGITRRTLQYYSGEGFIPKPIHIGRIAYYEKNIVNDLASLFILKNVFHLSLGTIAALSSQMKLTEITTLFHEYLRYYFEHIKKVRVTEAFVFELENNPIPAAIIGKLVPIIVEKGGPHGIDKHSFIEEIIKEQEKAKWSRVKKARAQKRA